MKLVSESVPGHFQYGRPLSARRRAEEWPDADPDVMLWRALDDRRREQFVLLSSITYHDVAGGRRVTVPAKFNEFRTDLTSVPSWFTWLVPKSGRHLPAALIHDGLVLDDPAVQTYRTDTGEVIDRIDADRIFRDAMRDSGVDRIRRWLVWSAVSVVSLMVGPRAEWSRAKQVYYRAMAALMLGTILWCGTVATLDLLDVSWTSRSLPWMAEGSFGVELVTGLAGSIVIPVLLACLWGRYVREAAIAGVALGALFHVTVAIAVVAGVYQAAEGAGRRLGGWAVVPAVLLVALSVVSVATVWLS